MMYCLLVMLFFDLHNFTNSRIINSVESNIPGRTKPKSPRPNIIWLSVEDMSPRLGCYGDFTVPTPNIDRLAKEGVRYTKVFTTAGVCAPSRNAIATGRIQTSNGAHNMRTLMNTFPEITGLPPQYSVVMPVGVKHFAEYLRQQGYYCTNNSKTDYQFEETPCTWDENGTKAHYKNRAPGQPFFAIFNSTITHESQVWARANRPLRVHPQEVKLPPYYPDTDSVRLDVARFYTNISEMDDWVGAQIKELESFGLLENTIVMFWSDHGDGLPYIKREVYERGIHIPLVIRFPLHSVYSNLYRAGSVNDRLISSIDLAPTVLSLAGIQTPDIMQGKAFLGKYTSKAHSYVFAARDRCDEHYDRVRSMNDGTYMYVYNFNQNLPRYQDITYRKGQSGMRAILQWRDEGLLNKVQMRWFEPTKPKEELYIMAQDPHALNDVSADPAHQKQLIKMRTIFQSWQTTVTDFGSIPEKEMIKQMWKGQAQLPITASPRLSKKGNKIAIICDTEGASIAYKVSKPSGPVPTSWQVYTKPIKVMHGESVTALAHRIGYKPSSSSSL